MNHGCHRLIFSHSRGQPMAVAETARGRRKAPGEQRRKSVSSHRLHALALVVALAFASLDAAAQIVAYRNAPGNQRPTVLDAGNGVPLVNIQTPSDAGVSRNTYSQFDVQQNGVILNNSRKGAQTHLAGQVAGNPWLAKGTAKVILNEVVSGDPSQLRGIIEVGGDRAEVVIANPAGIDVDGGGFINASRATLTTGVAAVSKGNLEGYAVRQGTITIHGGGLDASQTDYAAIIARAVKVNGAVHAKELKVITGANQVSADHNQVTPIAGSGPAPAFALDVSALGGMYAGKIRMIGTEAGVGVRNAGTIAASTGEVVITADGRLENSGQIISHTDAEIDVSGGLANSGTLYSRGTIRVTTRRTIDNSGLIGAAADVSLEAAGPLGEINSSHQSLLVAGLLEDGTLGGEGDLSLKAGRRLQARGINRAPRRIAAESPEISLGGSTTTARYIHLEAIPNSRRTRSRRSSGETGVDGTTMLASSSGIDLAGAALIADEMLTALTDGLLRTDEARVIANRIDIEAGRLSNLGGLIHQSGSDPFVLSIGGEIDNRRGVLSGNAAFTLSGASLLNDAGSINSGGVLTVDIAGHLDNGRGSIAGYGGATILAGSLGNSGAIDGSVGVRGDLDNDGLISGAASAGGTLDNGGMIGGDVSADTLLNSGRIGGNAHAGHNLENPGVIAGNAHAGASLSNSGRIAGTATAEADLANAGTIGRHAQANGRLDNRGRIGGDALAGGMLVNQGEIGGNAASGHALGNAGNIGGSAVAGGWLDNSGRIGGAASAGENFGNTGTVGGSVSAGGNVGNAGSIGGSVSAGGGLSNSGEIGGSAWAGGDLGNAGTIGGTVSAGGSVINDGDIGGSALAGQAIDNRGRIGSQGGDVLVSAGSVSNHGSIGRDGARVSVSAGHFDNAGGEVSGDRIGIVADRIGNVGGNIHADEGLVLSGSEVLDNTDGVIASNGSAVIADPGNGPAGRTLMLINAGGVLTAGGSLAIGAASVSLDGRIASLGDFSAALNGDYTYTPGQSFFEAGGRVSLVFSGTVTNHAYWHHDAGLQIGGREVINTGQISSHGLTLVQAGNTLNNQGSIAGEHVALFGGALDNQGGHISGNILDAVFSSGVVNRGGQIDIAGSSRIQIGGTLDNTGGRIDTGSLVLQVGEDLLNHTQADSDRAWRELQWRPEGPVLIDASRGGSGPRAGITARHGDLSLHVGGSLLMTGADLSASGNLDGLVLGDIRIDGLRLETRHQEQGITAIGLAGGAQGPGDLHRETDSLLIAADLHAGADLSLIAGGNAAFNGLDITAGGDLLLGAATGDLALAATTWTRQIDTSASSDAFHTETESTIAIASGGRISAGGSVGLLAGNDLLLAGVDAHAAGGQLTAVAGHDIHATALALLSTETRTRHRLPAAGEDYGLLPTDGEDRQQRETTEYHGGNFAAREGIAFDAGHGNPFSDGFLSGIDQARQAAGISAGQGAGRQSGSSGEGSLTLSGVNLLSGVPGDWRDIGLHAAGDLSINAVRGGARITESGPHGGQTGARAISQPLSIAGETVSTLTLESGGHAGRLQGANIDLSAGTGRLQLAGLAVEAGRDLGMHAGGDLLIDSSSLVSGRHLVATAEGALHVRGLVPDPALVPAAPDTLDGHATPTSAASALTAGGDLTLVSQAGIEISGSDLSGRHLTIATQGDLVVRGGSRHAEWSEENARHVRDEARATTLQAETVDLLAIGAGSDIHLSHVESVSSGATRILAGGDIAIDPGTDYRYDEWSTSSSSGFLIKRETSTHHIRESREALPSLISAGSLELAALGSLTLTASTLESTGDLTVRAGGDIRYLAARHHHYSLDESHTSRGFLGFTFQRGHDRHAETHDSALVTQLQSENDVRSRSDGDTTLEGTHIVSASGRIDLQAGRHLDILPTYSRSIIEDYRERSGLGFSSGGFGLYRSTTMSIVDETRIEGSLISGREIGISAAGDLGVTGSEIVGDGNVHLLAGGNLVLDAAHAQYSSIYRHEESMTGLFSSGGLSVTLGQREYGEYRAEEGRIAVGSGVGSIEGDVMLMAGSAYAQTGGSLLAPQGDIGIFAGRIEINEARDSSRSRIETHSRQSGLTLSLSSPAIGAVQTVLQMSEAAGKTRDPRMQALAAASAALAVHGNAGSLAALVTADSPAKAMQSGGFRLSLGVGTSHQESQSEQQSDTASGGLLQAGGDLTLLASGGSDSAILLRGLSAHAGGDLILLADGDIELQAARDEHRWQSRNSGGGASIGVSLGLGEKGLGPSLDLGLSRSEGSAEGHGHAWIATDLAAGESLWLLSGGDLTLQGARGSGTRIVADIGGDLHIESLQDESRHDSRQDSSGLNLSLCLPPCGGLPLSGSVTAGKSRIHSSHQSVTEQSGLYAGDGGFEIDIHGNASLVGGVIVSTQQAIDDAKNRFETGGGLSLTDIHNEAGFEGKASGVSLGFGASPSGELTPQGTSAGIGKVQGQAESMTLAAISGIAGDTQARTGDPGSGLAVIFDHQRVGDEIDAQVQITQTFGRLAPKAAATHASNMAASLNKQAEAENDPVRKAELQEEAKKWGPNGSYTIAMNIIIGAAGGNLNAAAVKEALSWAANEMRQAMITSSEKFKGLCDTQGNCISNMSGKSVGVNGDEKKVAGGRIVLSDWCAEGRCTKAPDGVKTDSGYLENPDGTVIFTPKKKDGNTISLEKFVEQHEEWRSPMGGHQGGEGKMVIAGKTLEYEKGSFWDRLAESYAGTHDVLNSPVWYDNLGNGKNLNGTMLGKIGDVANITNVGLATPFAMSVLLPPEVWNMIIATIRNTK